MKVSVLWMLTLVVLLSCGGGGGGASASAQVIWKNGSSGTWFGDPTVVSAASTASTINVIGASDPLSGDSQALQVSSPNGAGGTVSFPVPSAHDASAYASGHVQFDLRLDGSGISAVYVYFGGLYQGTTSFNKATVTTGALTTGSFTHVSIPVSAFSGGSTTSLQSITTPALITASATSVGPVFTVNNVRWTVD